MKKFIKRIDDKIENFFYHKVYRNYKSLYKGIKNIIRWTPIIWKDRDSDYEFIERVLYYKLANTYNFFVSKNSITNWEVKEQKEALKALRICIVILERRLNYFYVDICENIDSPHIIKYSFEIEKRDKERLGYLMGKYISHWWD